MDNELDFTEDEIREQLVQLGYQDVSLDRLKEFKRDLEELVKHEQSKNSSLFSTSDESSAAESSHLPYRGPSQDEHVYTAGISKEDHTRYGKENLNNFPAATHKTQNKDVLMIHKPQIHSETEISNTTAGPESHTSLQQHDRLLHYHPSMLKPESQSLPSQENQADNSMNTTTSSDRKFVKRKTMRKADNGDSEVYETESEAGDDVSSLQERLRALPIHVAYPRPSTAPLHGRSAEWHHYKRPQSAQEKPVFRLPDDYEGVKALIHPMKKQPHMQNIKKTDPVTRFQQYASSWGQQKAPGEKNHKGLRWSVREHMLYHDEVVQKKQNKVFVPNNYVVPTDKKRKNLRWQIRNDLAQGVKPPSMFD